MFFNVFVYSMPITSEATSDDIQLFLGLKISTLDSFCMFLGELVGTAFLLLFGCLGGLKWTEAEQPQFIGGFLFGLTVLTIIQCFGSISGAHLNPAVTLCAVMYRLISVPVSVTYFRYKLNGSLNSSDFKF